MGPVRPHAPAAPGTDRLYQRVIALGCIWCILGLALGSALFIRLRAVSDSASKLSSEILPVEHSLERLSDGVSWCDALAGRLVTERRSGEDTTTTSQQLREKLADLEASIPLDAERALSGANLDSVRQLQVDAMALLQAARRLLEPGIDPAEEAECLRRVHDLAQSAERSHDYLSHQVMAREIERLVSDLVSQSERILDEAILTGLVAVVSGTFLTVAVGRRVRRQELAQASERDRQDFHARVSDALGMVQDEPSAFRLLREVLDRVAPGTPAEILLADSSRAHMEAVVTSEAAAARLDGGASLCSVSAPSLCPAVRRGYAISFETSEAFDACPHLRGRPGGACGATCVPLSIMGRHVGVLHAVAPPDHPLPSPLVERLTVLAAKAGDRLGVLRAFAQSERQAARDSLTGLLNRRSVEAEVQRLQRAGSSFCIAYADIDHFKRLNDTHGHETGDRALRLFSRVLREALRPTDVTGRWGGEEFVILLPGVDIDTARVALDRVRGAVQDATASSGLPRFSVSFGLASCDAQDDFFECLAKADAALLAAKQQGRNCVRVAQEKLDVLGAVKAA